MKNCSNPKCVGRNPQPLENFSRDSSKASGYGAKCKACRNAKYKTERYGEDEAPEAEAFDDFLARKHRLESDHEPLKPSDLKEDYSAPNYDREKKQEYSKSMGTFSQSLRDITDEPEKLAEFISLTAEQERRWLNKRLARSTSLGAAREVLFVRQFEEIAARVKWPAEQRGYTVKKSTAEIKRLVSLLLTDLHVGAMLPGDENPQAFDFVCAGRRLAHLAVQTAEFKTRYRDSTKLLIHLAGDLIEGWLGHGSDWDNAPLPEQCNAVTFFLFNLISYLAAAFPEVEIHCQTGNHGRDLHRHQGRATSSRQKSFETMIYVFLREQCKPLANVKFFIPRSPWEVIPLFNKNMLLLHGDAEVKLKSPGSSGGIESWRAAIAKMNSERTYRAHIDLLAAGHFHFPLPMYFADGMGLCNGALVPPNGYARAAGMGDGLCGQFLWESVENYAFGDSRLLRVGVEQDIDTSLNDVIPKFVWV